MRGTITANTRSIVNCLSVFSQFVTPTSSLKFSGLSSHLRNSSLSMSTKSDLFWNRELSKGQAFDKLSPVVKEARIISLTDSSDDANNPINTGSLPKGSKVLAIGGSVEELDVNMLREKEANVVFVSHPKAREPLAMLLKEVPSIEWIHARSAGIDFVASPELSQFQGTMTNAKGTFSSTLAEYSLMACAYFAKDLPLLMKQNKVKNWNKYPVLELRGATMGIVGYGDIGRACARLASAYGMKIKALRRNPTSDPLCDAVYGNDEESLNRIFAECDYVVCAAPLTSETKDMIGKKQFEVAKEGCVFINVGRGPIVDEEALIEALGNGKIKGAGLDVFAMEPLPKDSPLWDMDNVLLSPHNMDMTATFMQEASDFFVQENLPRFLRGLPLLNPVDPASGY